MHEKDLCKWKMEQWKQKWNIKTDRGQRVYEKSDPEWNIVKNCSFFCIFCWWQQKSISVLAKCLSSSERSCLAPSENAMDYWILSYP